MLYRPFSDGTPNGKDKLRAKLNELGPDGAVKIAMLASVAGELSVSEYNPSKAERLEALAQLFAVDTSAVRKSVDRKMKEKGQRKATPTTEGKVKPVTKSTVNSSDPASSQAA